MSYKILCQDSLIWLNEQKDYSIPNIVTGIPDLNEIPNLNNDLDQYLKFFNEVSRLIFKKVKKDGYSIFIQTDRRFNTQLIDKSYLLTHQAYQLGLKLLWHKIICQRNVGSITLHRPSFSHFLCYSYQGRSGIQFEDILPVSEKMYDNGTPLYGAKVAIEFIAKQIKNQKRNKNDFKYDIVDIFTGESTIGVFSILKNLSFLGIDIDQKQCQLSNKMLECINQIIKSKTR